MNRKLAVAVAVVAAMAFSCSGVYTGAQDAVQNNHVVRVELGEQVIERAEARQFLIKFYPHEGGVMVQSPDGKTRLITAQKDTGLILLRVTSKDASGDVVVQMGTDRAKWNPEEIDPNGDSKSVSYGIVYQPESDKSGKED